MKGISVGVNVDFTSYKKRLRDGGTSLVFPSGDIVSIAEERVSGVKHDCGYDNSWSYLKKKYEIKNSDIDVVVVSSCIDFPDKSYDVKFAPNAKLLRVGHHLSHAYSTFIPSPFEKAIIIVYDAGGDILSKRNSSNGNKWWLYPREQVTCYIGEGQKIRRLCRVFDKPRDVGPGEAYRAFTYYIGWPSYTYSANTMALAAYGDPSRFSGSHIFVGDKDHFLSRSNLVNDPEKPVEMLQNFAVKYNLPFPPPMQHIPSVEELTQEYKDLAAYAQSEIERFIISLVRYLVKKTGIKNLCLAGGVALNCVANTKILENTDIDDIFIIPAAGDTGQSFGNAIYGYLKTGGKREDLQEFSPYLGPHRSPIEIRYIFSIMSRYDVKFEVRPIDVKYVARRLKEGYIVGWFRGRSEFGPRALGHRSILADPRAGNESRIIRKLRRIKSREEFRPFSPSILRSFVNDYFDMPVSDSPYMLLVARAKGRTQALVPSVVHVDGTSRLQTVDREDNPFFWDLIYQFYDQTGIPMLLNTSLNRKGEPIVETPDKALDIFAKTDMDILVLDNFIVEKVRIKKAIVYSDTPLKESLIA